MYLVQVGLCLWLISQRCYAGLTKDIEQTKILDDGLELSNRELTQGERDFAMFPELSSKDSFPDHGDTGRSKEESTDVSPASSAEGNVPTGSQARLSSAIDSDRSSEDGPISAISKGKQHAHSVPLYEQYISSYGGSARRDFQGQLSHYQGNPRFDPHATAMHPFPITNQYWALAPNDLPGPDVLIPAFSNAEVAAMHSPFGQAMAVMPSPLTPGLLSDHIQAPLPYYNTHLIHEGNPQEFVPSHISDPQSIYLYKLHRRKLVKKAFSQIMIAEANSHNDRYKAIDAILEDYKYRGGSSHVSMVELRDQVAEIYNPQAPDFLYHWSAVARVAIALDHRDRRIQYGTVDEMPKNADPMGNPPIVLSRKVKSPFPAEYYRPPRGFVGERKPAGVKTPKGFPDEIEHPDEIDDASMFPAGGSHHVSQPAPPSPPPPPFNPRLPSPNPPPSSGKGKNRRRHRKRRSSNHSQGGPKAPQVPLSLRVAPTTQPTASASRTQLPPTRPNNSLFDRMAHTARQPGKQPTPSVAKNSKRRRYSSPPSSSSSSSSSDGFTPPPPAPAVSGAPATSGSEGDDDDGMAPFLAHNEHLSPEAFTPLSREIQQIALLYKSNIKKYVSLFNSCGNRPANWHNSLTRDLLEYNFVDLRKLYGEVSSGKPSESFLKVNDSGKLKSIDGATPKEITDNNHWKDLMAVLRHAYIAAYPPAATAIKKYFDYIFGLPGLFQAKVNWEDVRDFDVELRKEFSSRPWLVWGDYAHDSLRGIDNRVLYSAASRFSQTHRAATSSSNAARVASTPMPYQSSSATKTSQPKPRGKRNKPKYAVKPGKNVPLGDQVCNNWNLGVCPYTDAQCDRIHNLCNKVGCDGTHQGGREHK
ncbi:uncharacterized protein MELLADRAFT_112896 [Melampsora larici-populina 98AG31]|uniref:C3H1-type domain-containing protein n=1 Tax=Melampsora larici-populina (strain 98AG31 / pathotype 3-4-7) TaxID=747676 RepID=F4S816_MELLP|nr:uncharacterized protein MELLADRAFT_112896 [Melampsora larici-populina 98AG31]EGF99234.1 hypothetical protein MELLADRAFT_112896 [Melampsora larici-populina 98AG31]